ncbi:MAG: metal ABC transporter substrate-binding protein [Candidatus Micrarchaeota archaeon]
MKRMIPAILLVLCLAFFGCTQEQTQQTQSDSGKINVVVSFYPLYDFTKNVGEDKVEITTLIPNGVEPHEFEPTPNDMKRILNADIFIYNGANMEPWLPNLLKNLDDSNVILVDTSRNIELIQNDPHIWLDPMNAKKQVESIKDALVQKDPSNTKFYEESALIYESKLDTLDFEIQSAFADCANKNILITHATLAYFCKRYGCTQIAITGVNPEAEPSPADLANIIEQAKANGVKAVFFESLINPKSAELIANELGGYTLVFNSVHGITDDEKAQGKDYISLMEDNLQNIGKNCR